MNYKNPHVPASLAFFLAHANRDGVECRNGIAPEEPDATLRLLTERGRNFKEKEARQSTSEPEAESSQETDADGVSAAILSHKAERPRRRRAKQQSL